MESDERLPDFQFYHFGGKDRIAGIGAALKAVNVPTVAVVDFDVLADRAAFRKLFTALGGDYACVEEHVKRLQRCVNSLVSQASAAEARAFIEGVIANWTGGEAPPREDRTKIMQRLSSLSPWQALKKVGYRGLQTEEALVSFEAIEKESKKVGLIINREGELESLVPTMPRTDKGDWLARVLDLDLRADRNLDLSRAFMGDLTEVLREQVEGGT